MLGAFYVFSNLVALPRLGAATSLSIFVCSQVRTLIVIPRGFLDPPPPAFLSCIAKTEFLYIRYQVIMACIIDHTGAVGVTQRDYTPWRILASFGMIFCVFIIARF